MIHETVITKKMLVPGDERTLIGIPSTIPTLLKKERDYFHVITDGKLSVGDELKIWPLDKIIVGRVIETRKARGDWSGESWKGMSPTWSKIQKK